MENYTFDPDLCVIHIHSLHGNNKNEKEITYPGYFWIKFPKNNTMKMNVYISKWKEIHQIPVLKNFIYEIFQEAKMKTFFFNS